MGYRARRAALQIGKLLLLNGRQLRELTSSKRQTTLQLIKRGPSRHTLLLSESSHQLLKENKQSIDLLLKDKSLVDPVFYRSRDLEETMSRSKFTNEINQVLKRYSAIFAKHLWSHSLRASVITSLLRENSVHEVRSFIGHATISTTVVYNRSTITTKDRERLVQTLEIGRAHV